MAHPHVTRRDFIRWGAAAALWPLAAGCGAGPAEAAEPGEREALAYEKMDGALVRCRLCPRGCVVPDGRRGYCQVRQNRAGTYHTLVYGRICSAHVDPIEKKPLFHFLPGTAAFSLAAPGCNVECQWCQNWQISQVRPEDIRTEHLPPDKAVEVARAHESPTIAFTYSEPTVFYEYCLDTARAAREAGVRCVSITNGYIQAEPMKRLCEVLSAVKVDLKGFTEEFYRRYVHGELAPVLATLELVRRQGVHLEIVTLLIPGLNDGEEELRELSRWVVRNLGPDVPLHFTRFHPDYKMTNLARTPAQTVERARQIAAAEGVRYAYTGNLPGSKHQSTFCPECGELVVGRYGFYVGKVHLKDGNCAHCGAPIPGVWA